MTQKSLLHAVAAQIANGYETAEVPMYSEQLRMPDRKVIIKIIENLQKVFFPAYFAGGTVSHVSAETFAEFLLGEIYTDPQFARNYSECKRLGIPCGVYGYFKAVNQIGRASCRERV